MPRSNVLSIPAILFIFNALPQNPPEGTVPVAFHPMHSCLYLFDTYSDMGLGSVHRLAVCTPQKNESHHCKVISWDDCARVGTSCMGPNITDSRLSLGIRE